MFKSDKTGAKTKKPSIPKSQSKKKSRVNSNLQNKENSILFDNINRMQRQNHNQIEERGEMRKSQDYKNSTDHFNVFQLQNNSLYSQANEGSFINSYVNNRQGDNMQLNMQQVQNHKQLFSIDFSEQSKMHFNNDKAANESQQIAEIKGRKIDSPQLVVIKELNDVAQNGQFKINNRGTISCENLNLGKGYQRSGFQLNESMKYGKKLQNNKQSRSVEKRQNTRSSCTKQKPAQKTKADCQKSNFTGTKSSRELKSQIGFNDILSQLDRENSACKSRVPNFKNKTQSQSHQYTNLIKEANKKVVRKQKQKENQQSKKVFKYEVQNNNPITPVKNQHQGATNGSFQNSEHGRCITSQALTQTQQMLQNNRAIGAIQKSNSQCRSRSKNFKAIGDIDKLIKENLKKNLQQYQVEKQRQRLSQEKFKKKKEELNQINSLVRQLNKSKTYKKHNQTLNLQQASDIQVGIMKSDSPLEKQLKYKLKRRIETDHQFKGDITQQIDFEKIKLHSKGKLIDLKNRRKSYGLDFLDIKKEIKNELKTIDERIKNESSLVLNQTMQDFRVNNTEDSDKKVKIKKTQKQEKIEKNEANEKAPINKVIIVKKSKIKKFIRDKKKEQYKQQQEKKLYDIHKAQKVQQNLIKLNKFYEKSVKQQIHCQKIKLTTNKLNQTKLNKSKDLTKLNLKIKPLNKKSKSQALQILRQEETASKEQESNEKSSEFYEEYFRLMSSLKKRSSKDQTKDSQELISSFKQNRANSKLQLSTKNETLSPITNIMKSKTIESPNKTTYDKKKNSRKNSKSNHKNKKSLPQDNAKVNKKHLKLAKLSSKEHIRVKKSSSIKNSRAQSAPLIQQLSNKKQKLRGEQKRKTKPQQQPSYEELVQKVLTIQRNYRYHLYRKGFYDIDFQNVEKQQNHLQYSYIDSEEQANEVETVKQVDSNNNTLKMDEDIQYEFNSDEDFQDDGILNPMVIINQVDQDDSQNKVIYFSNINSCSIPQTPKEQSQIQQRNINENKEVFEYKQEQINNETQREIQNQDNEEAKNEYGSNNYNINSSNDQFRQSDSKFNEYRIHSNQKEYQKSVPMSLMSSQNTARYRLSIDSKSQIEHASVSSQSIFERNSFQQFAKSRLQDASKNQELKDLIKIREQALEYKVKKEGKLLKKMHKKKQISPKTYKSKKQQLEKWVQLEQDDIRKTKKTFKEEWEKTMNMIEETQQNVEQMRQNLHVGYLKSSSRQVYSQISRNSSQSYLISGKSDNRRSVFEDEPPKSYRSNQNLQKQKENLLLNQLEEIQKQKKEQIRSEMQKNQRQGIYIEDQKGDDGEQVKTLQRSLSEQDLSDLFRQTRVNFNEVVSESPDSISKKFNTVQKLSSAKNQQIEILDDDNYVDSKQVQENQLNQLDDISSNVSILNENYMNQLIQEQNKFAIEEFKAMNDQQDLSKREQVNQEQQDKEWENTQINEKECMELETKHEPQENIYGSVNIPITSGQYHELLFQNAKPGQNIKIADILRQSQLRNRSFDNDSQQIENQEILCQQNLSNQKQEQDHLVDQITQQIYDSIIQQTFEQLPRRIQTKGIDENQDVFLLDLQQNEKDFRRDLIEQRQRELVEQDLQQIELYTNELIATLLQSEVNHIQNLQHNNTNDQNYHMKFLEVLTNPIQKNPLDVLTQLQTSEIGSYTHFETATDLIQYPIIPVDVYLEIERQREQNLLENSEQLEPNLVQESLHIKNKAVFDALNESLLKFRPYGIQGEPMPFSNKNRRLQTRVDINSVDTECLFVMVKQDVMRWAQVLAGSQPTQVFKFAINQQNNGNDQQVFDEDLFHEVREKRLAALLSQEVVENEHQWLNYEFEENQIKIDLSDMVLEHLVEEAVTFLDFKEKK